MPAPLPLSSRDTHVTTFEAPWADRPMTAVEADAFHIYHAARQEADRGPTIVDVRELWLEAEDHRHTGRHDTLRALRSALNLDTEED